MGQLLMSIRDAMQPAARFLQVLDCCFCVLTAWQFQGNSQVPWHFVASCDFVAVARRVCSVVMDVMCMGQHCALGTLGSARADRGKHCTKM
jgi:hypothetical protein